MLRSLDIADMLIIERLELEFQPGLNVLTGETGAGKSILLDALGFVLGWRGRADLVRQGAEQGEAVAVFDLSPGHAAHAILDEAGLPGGDELILRRVNTVEGRKTAWVNDRRCSGDVLRRLGDTLVELHGQHDDRGLLNPRGHRAILDAFGGLDTLRADVRAAWTARRKAGEALAAAEAAIRDVRAEEETLRDWAEELDRFDPQPGEEADLDARRRLMQGAEKIRNDVVRAHEALGQNGAETAMSDALRWLDGAAAGADGHLDEPMEALARALAELDAASDGIARAIDALSFDPDELDGIADRLLSLRELGRKHRVAPDELSAVADDLRSKLAALDAGDADLARLRAALAAAEADYDAAAERLGTARHDAATRLDAAVRAELGPLKMERAEFRTEIVPEAPGPDGREAVAFTVATNPGAPSGPLNRIASGGELSRFLLALKVCLAQGQAGLTMIFDEIDRGVGGATADAVGRRLAALAAGGQVIVVTHSPQVAALGAHHWRVEKRVTGETTTSTVVPLAPADRVDEIARMLSGDTVTDQARGAAEALLAG
ncbi:DNA repair protein RecN [Sulfitobacter sp. D35]|uniref:DNA repair protein RecN n=1 Tax=Sulfitobacter sp. D35 TaxID=3083252 RepID=UPI00296EBBCD|nr:DNA repair protein RecN [Sulfitobacter sp. D35]MDW4497465.1 DNA repair protein RecN [Sulfitobacter sp. D35]